MNSQDVIIPKNLKCKKCNHVFKNVRVEYYPLSGFANFRGRITWDNPGKKYIDFPFPRNENVTMKCSCGGELERKESDMKKKITGTLEIFTVEVISKYTKLIHFLPLEAIPELVRKEILNLSSLNESPLDLNPNKIIIHFDK